MIRREYLSEPWFSLVILGEKTLEVRLNKREFRTIKEGDIIEWYNSDIIDRKVYTRINKVYKYKTFKELLHNEGIYSHLPTITETEDALKIYYKNYLEEDEKKYGILSFELTKICF